MGVGSGRRQEDRDKLLCIRKGRERWTLNNAVGPIFHFNLFVLQHCNPSMALNLQEKSTMHPKPYVTLLRIE